MTTIRSTLHRAVNKSLKAATPNTRFVAFRNHGQRVVVSLVEDDNPMDLQHEDLYTIESHIEDDAHTMCTMMGPPVDVLHDAHVYRTWYPGADVVSARFESGAMLRVQIFRATGN